jgi:heme/copper-type cytochrome/quinol oxidase subunit 2
MKIIKTILYILCCVFGFVICLGGCGLFVVSVVTAVATFGQHIDFFIASCLLLVASIVVMVLGPCLFRFGGRRLENRKEIISSQEEESNKKSEVLDLPTTYLATINKL